MSVPFSVMGTWNGRFGSVAVYRRPAAVRQNRTSSVAIRNFEKCKGRPSHPTHQCKFVPSSPPCFRKAFYLAARLFAASGDIGLL